jgi:cysteine desulfurase
MMEKIYVDHAATSPTHPEVVEQMLPYFTNQFGNPSSIHHFGRENRRLLDETRAKIAQSISAKANDIVFTSGGTEADNLAIIGAARANQAKGNHIITTAIEHHAVLHTCEYLEANGFRVTYLPVDDQGRISIQELKSAITEETTLVSIMFANNEVGTVQAIKEIGTLLKEKDITFHTDAVQAYGLLDINVAELDIDLLSVSGHKINGPKGIGFLYVREGVKLIPHQYGGEQERKRRAGTENVPAIAGLKKAVEIATSERKARVELYQQFRDKMIEVLQMEQINFKVNGHPEYTLPNILNVSFIGIKAEAMLMNLDLSHIAASSGSACTAGAIDPSHVLVAMFGEGDERVETAIRFSFGYGNSLVQIEHVAQQVVAIVKRITKE